jgi:enoyl-CoA hydratase
LEGRLNDDGDAWVLVLTGAGNETFCSGADLEEGVGGLLSGEITFDPLPRRWFSHCYKPIIAAVNGFATGGGMELVLLTDLRIAAENASFGLPEVRWGLVPQFGGCCNLPHQIPHCRAMEILLTGDRISAEEALQFGLVNRVVPREELMSSAMQMAERLCQNGPVALRLTKEVALKSRGIPREMGYLMEMEIGGRFSDTEDAREGPMAFFQKRKPNFRGM